MTAPEGASEFSVFKEAALVLTLLSGTINLVGFVSTAWATPDREYDPTFEGLGLWKYCYIDVRYRCDQATELNMPGQYHFLLICLKSVGFSMV